MVTEKKHTQETVIKMVKLQLNLQRKEIRARLEEVYGTNTKAHDYIIGKR